ncbi:MAG: hypothetical protein J7501_11010 [Bdellovibrio sp.]|nr:hypothetical protein [Bdellovibrio sp.]
MIKKMILTLSVLSLAACAFEKDETGSDPQTRLIAEQNQKVDKNFSGAVGIYSGDLVRSNGVEKIQLSLQILGEPTGKTNKDGTQEILKRQAAAYLRINPVGASLTNFAVTFIRETGELMIVNKTANIGIDEVHTIFAKLAGDKITGRVVSMTGVIGTINLSLTAKENANPSNGTEEEQYARLREQYNTLKGDWVGCVKTTQGSTVPAYTVKMSLSLFEDASDGKTTVPRLAGNFHRDNDPKGALDSQLSGTYRPDLRPATLNITGKPIISNNGYVSTFQGTVADGNYEASFSSTRKGFEGMLYLKKGNTYPAKCAGIK